jgi:hypothetical protein
MDWLRCRFGSWSRHKFGSMAAIGPIADGSGAGAVVGEGMFGSRRHM